MSKVVMSQPLTGISEERYRPSISNISFTTKERTPYNIITKSKVFKPRHNVKLKKKRNLNKHLKKYKLRKDGCNDPDVIDVSKSLSDSLKIKSPSKCCELELEADKYVGGENTLKLEIIGRIVLKSQQDNMPKETTVDDTKSKGKIRCTSKEKECRTKPISDAQVNNNKMIHMNAFQVMMNARNKTMGISSPRKFLPSRELVKQDVPEETHLTIKNKVLPNIVLNNTGLEVVEKTKSKRENVSIKERDTYQQGKKMPYTSSVSKCLSLKRRRSSNTGDKGEENLKKRLINLEIEESEKKLICNDILKPMNGNIRPKRTVRKPVRYTEVELSSSDDEYHIFTPPKKGNTRNTRCTTDYSQSDLKIEPNLATPVAGTSANTTSVNDTDIKNTHNHLKPPKLAPIFVSKTSTDKDIIEAKIIFLQSGVPEILKKAIEKQQKHDLKSTEFIPIRHIQQRDTSDTPWNLKMISSKYNCIDLSETTLSVCNWHKILNKVKERKKDTREDPILSCNSDGAKVALQKIKQGYLKFPVYKVYNSLKNIGSRLNTLGFTNRDDGVNEMDQANIKNIDFFDNRVWTDKYRAMNSSDIIGNFSSVNSLKKWLIAKKEADFVITKGRHSKYHDSDSSDFYASDSDSRESLRFNNNLAIVTGPTGSGKTYSIYALANELCMKVIEVNVSSRRTGKKILSDLQEATQSHKVNRQAQDCNSDNSQEIQAQDTIKRTFNKMMDNPIKKTKNKKKASYMNCDKLVVDQNETKTAMSLILIDDADIVFEQDDGFVSGLTQIVQMSKRPVVIVTSTLSCPHLLKFVPSATVFKFNPLMPKLLGTWLNILSVVEIGEFWPMLGPFIINHYKGDMRKSINAMQFVCSSYKNGSDIVDDLEIINEDDSSNSSWMERDTLQTNQTSVGEIAIISKLMEPFLGTNYHSNNLMLEYPLNMDNAWHAIKAQKMFSEDSPAKIELLSFVSDSISIAELITHRKNKIVNYSKTESKNIFRSCRFDHGISDKENLLQFDEKIALADEIAFEVAHKSFAMSIEKSNHLDKNLQSEAEAISFHDKVQEKHEVIAQSLFPANTILDRKALALDYFSSCREICRVEKTKMGSSTRRNNRFYHYLKSLNSSCKNDVLSSLCESLQSKL